MLADCGEGDPIAYNYMNVTDVTAYAVLVLFMFLAVNTKQKTRGPVKMDILKTEKTMEVGVLFGLLTWLGLHTHRTELAVVDNRNPAVEKKDDVGHHVI